MLRCKRASCMTEVKRELNPIREPWVCRWCWGYVFCVLVFMLIDLKRLDDLWQGIFYLFIFWQGWAPLCGRPRYFPFTFKSRRARCQCFSLSFTLVIFITSCMQEILLRANTFQLWSLTHSPARLFRDAKRGGVWGELGTEWMLCREKKINPQAAFSLHFFQEEASFLADVLILITSICSLCVELSQEK